MSEIEKAEKVLADLQTKQRDLARKAVELADERQQLGFAAHADGNKKARARLDEINGAIAVHQSETASLEAAITEATKRLAQAKQAAALAQDRANAEQLRDTITEFVALGEEIDAALTDAAAHIANMPALLNKIHALGSPAPSHEQFRVLGAQAVKTHLMGLSVFNREFEHLAPNQRRTFEQIVTKWQEMILNNIAARLGNKEAA
jgi:chromosome segregation ATPase